MVETSVVSSKLWLLICEILLLLLNLIAVAEEKNENRNTNAAPHALASALQPQIIPTPEPILMMSLLGTCVDVAARY